MSIRAMTWAFAQTTGSPASKLVLIKLADNANDDGVCWPSIGYLERHCELSRTAIKDNIRKLADAGFLTIQERFKDGVQLPHLYHVQVPVEVQPSADRVGRQPTDGRSPADRGVGRQVTTEPSVETIIKPLIREQATKVAFKSPDKGKESEAVKVKSGERPKCAALAYMDDVIARASPPVDGLSLADMVAAGAEH